MVTLYNKVLFVNISYCINKHEQTMNNTLQYLLIFVNVS